METKQIAFIDVSQCAVQVCRHLTLIILDIVMVRSIYVRSRNSELEAHAECVLPVQVESVQTGKAGKAKWTRLLLATLADTRW